MPPNTGSHADPSTVASSCLLTCHTLCVTQWQERPWMQSPTLLTQWVGHGLSGSSYKYGVILRTQYLIQSCRKLGGGLPVEPSY